MVEVEKVLDQQETALGVFLDTEGAFNSTSYGSMCAALVRYGVDHTIVWWIRATPEGRMAAAVTLDGSSMGIAVSRGCPQVCCGCLCGALLLIARFSGGCDTYSRLYSDICLLVVGKFPNGVGAHAMGPS